MMTYRVADDKNAFSESYPNNVTPRSLYIS